MGRPVTTEIIQKRRYNPLFDDRQQGALHEYKVYRTQYRACLIRGMCSCRDQGGTREQCARVVMDGCEERYPDAGPRIYILNNSEKNPIKRGLSRFLHTWSGGYLGNDE